MGKDFGPTTRAAGNYEIHKCGHTKGESKPAAECIMEQIGECPKLPFGSRSSSCGFIQGFQLRLGSESQSPV